MIQILILFIGGAASGKSQLAEELCEKLRHGEKAYIATMAIKDLESELRVQKHRAMRRNKGFSTIECSLCEPAKLTEIYRYPLALMECISNLLANELYIGRKSRDEAVDVICEYVKEISKGIQHLVIVSNDVFGDGVSYNTFTRDYMFALAQINRRLAELSDCVIEAVYGIPVYLKGEAF